MADPRPLGNNHEPRITRYQRGTQTYGQLRGAAGMQYGTMLRCDCGWSIRENTAPSAGGRKRLLELHGRHVEEMTRG